MKNVSTYFLRLALCVFGLIVLALCIFALPSMSNGMAVEFPTVPYLRYSVLIFYATVIPFFVALWQGFKLLNYIDKNIAFSDFSVKALRKIKYCATSISVLYLLGMPFAFMVAQADDAPGLIIVAFVFACSPLVIAVFAALLEKLLRSAIAIQSENDLTV